MIKIRITFSFLALFCATLLTTSCFSVSKRDQILSSSGAIRHDDPQCAERQTDPQSQKALNKEGFTLTSWNIYKQNNDGWRKDLNALSKKSDLMLLQEAYLTQELTQLLGITQEEWEMISAFRYQGIHAGVMTASDIPSIASCAQRIIEPLAQLPKSSLISFFPIQGRSETLLVANIHAINFTPGLERFTSQLEEIKSVMSKHTGPMVFAGDFNTWSQSRMDVLNELTSELGMEKVEFADSEPVKMFGSHLDHIFFSGMTLDDATAVAVDSSDHYPLTAKFKFAKKRRILN